MLIPGLKVKINSLLAVILLLASCSGKELGPDEYTRWVENKNNGCISEKSIGGMQFTAMHKPLEYVVLKECGGNMSLFDSLKGDFEGMEYYTIKMRAESQNKDVLLHNIGSEQEYYERINYYTTNAQHDVYLVEAGDTIYCELYHYERSYGVSPYNSMLLGFKTRPGNRDKPAKLCFNETVFNTGLLLFNFDKNNLPTLTIN